MSGAPDRGPYIPSPDGLNAEFFARAREGTLHLQRCRRCGRFRHPPRYLCAGCGSPESEWIPSRGTGTLFSWTVTHRPYDPGWAEAIPYVTGVIELSEGVRLVGALPSGDRADLRLGRPLQVRLEPRTETFTFIALLPASTPPDHGG